MKLAAVVVTYNRLAELQVTVARLLSEAVDAVVVVDNASCDGTEAWLARQDDPRLDVIRLAENTGGAGGFEAGVTRAWTHYDPEWVVLMDDDARPAPGALAAFLQEALSLPEDLGAAVAAVFLPDGQISEMNRPSLNPFWHWRTAGRGFSHLMRGNKRGFHIADAAFEGREPVEIDAASFVGFFLHRRGFKAIGAPDGGYFIYGDDVTYSLRLRRARLRIAMLPLVRFEHDCGTLSVDLATRPLWKVYYLSRNGVALTWHAARWLAPVAFAYYLLQWSRKARYYSAAERGPYRVFMWLGVWHGLLRRRGRYDPAHVKAAQLANRDKTG